MFNFKASGIAGAAGFILSLLVGLAAGAAPLYLFIRAGCFGALFFGLAAGIQFLINSFVPEALEPASDTGGRLDISVGDDGDEPEAAAPAALPGGERFAPIPQMYQDIAASDNDDVGNINDFLGMDQNAKEQYTSEREESGEQPKPDGIWEDVSPVELADLDGEAVGFGAKQGSDKPDIPAMTAGSVDVLPDLDSLANSFSSSPESSSGAADAGAAFGQKKKEPAMKGDFNPKDMAEGLRTLLKKDQT